MSHFPASHPITTSVTQPLTPPVRPLPFTSFPPSAGLYDRANEHDACGVAFVATMRGEPGHDIVDHALTALRNLDHRGAVGAETNTGDGAGILTQVPDEFLRAVMAEQGVELPAKGAYAVGNAFLPVDETERAAAVARIEEIAVAEGLDVLGWRDVPVTADLVGQQARAAMPFFAQLFVATRREGLQAQETGIVLDRRVYALRKLAERELAVYFPSLSSRTMVYKGMLTTGQLEPFFPTSPTAGSPPSSAWSTPASRRTRSRAGRWRTRSGPSPTTARSTPSRATGTGPPPASRRCPPRSSRVTSSASARSARPRAPTPPPSTRSWSCCTSADGPCRTRC